MHHCASVTLNEPWALSVAGIAQGGAGKCNSVLTCDALLGMHQKLLKAEFVMGPHKDSVDEKVTETISDFKCTCETTHASMGVQV